MSADQGTHWMKGPLLFLDIDGVLNSSDWAVRTEQRGLLGLDPEAVARLQRVVDETGCSIILSSTWRLLHSLSEMRGLLIEAGMRSPVPLRDRTPDLTTKTHTGSQILKAVGRGMEVNAWLDNIGFEGRYCCIDDDSDFLPGQPLVKTTFQSGMLDSHADQCIAILKGQP